MRLSINAALPGCGLLGCGNSLGVSAQSMSRSILVKRIILFAVFYHTYVRLKGDENMMPPQPPTVNRNPLDFGDLPQGGSRILQETISNPGEQPLLWHADTGGTSWLSLDKITGTIQPGQQEIVNVTVDSSSLAVGSYDATLTFTSVGDEFQASVQVLVTLVISPVLAPAVGLSFGTLFWKSSRTLPLLISNRDNQTVDWTVDKGGTNWLTLNRNSGTLQAHEQQTIYVTANSSSLEIGGYAATLVLTSEIPGIKSAGVQIPVDLHVGIIPYSDNGPHYAVIGRLRHGNDDLKSPLYTPALSFDAQSNTFPLLIGNPKENGKVDWTLNDGGVSWLELDKSIGTLQPGEQLTIQVTTNNGDLQPGTYRTDLILTFTFDPMRAVQEPTPVLIPVTMTIP
jgi:Viral BACON domain